MKTLISFLIIFSFGIPHTALAENDRLYERVFGPNINYKSLYADPVKTVKYKDCPGYGICEQPPEFDPNGKRRYVIFLVHGIGGDQTTFPYLEETLEHHLNRVGSKRPGSDVDYKYEVVLLKYATGKKDKDSKMFAMDISKAIDSYFEGGKSIRDEDNIGLIMHSQGGIVGSQWIFNSFLEQGKIGKLGKDGKPMPTFFHPQYAQHIESAITLGTPFWGTKQANLIEDFLDQVGKSGIVSEKEIQDMMYGCNKIYDFRQAAITLNEAGNDENGKFIAELGKRVRILNIGGFIPRWNTRALLGYAAGPFTSGDGDIENDLAVVLPSSRFDFMYYREDGIPQDGFVSADEYKETRLGDFTVVPALHVNPRYPVNAKWAQLPSMAQIDEACVKSLECEHPTVKAIAAHILRTDPEFTTSEEFTKKMTSFLIDMNVIVPIGTKATVEDFKFKWKIIDSDVKVDRVVEVASSGRRQVVEHARNQDFYIGRPPVAAEQYRRFFFTGTIDNAYDIADPKRFKKKVVEVTISGNGVASRTIEIPVRATMSSFVDMYMKVCTTNADEEISSGTGKISIIKRLF